MSADESWSSDAVLRPIAGGWWWRVLVYVTRGSDSQTWHLWTEFWVPFYGLADLPAMLRREESAGIYNTRRIVLQQWAWDAENGWAEMDHM